MASVSEGDKNHGALDDSVDTKVPHSTTLDQLVARHRDLKSAGDSLPIVVQPTVGLLADGNDSSGKGQHGAAVATLGNTPIPLLTISSLPNLTTSAMPVIQASGLHTSGLHTSTGAFPVVIQAMAGSASGSPLTFFSYSVPVSGAGLLPGSTVLTTEANHATLLATSPLTDSPPRVITVAPCRTHRDSMDYQEQEDSLTSHDIKFGSINVKYEHGSPTLAEDGTGLAEVTVPALSPLTGDDMPLSPSHAGKVKRGKTIQGIKEDRMCKVCGDKALGCNFDAVSCESCKAFFRRNALKDKQPKCLFEGNCKIDINTRRFCPFCRLQKCFQIGMKKELILGDDEKKKRNDKVKVNRQKRQVKPSGGDEYFNLSAPSTPAPATPVAVLEAPETPQTPAPPTPSSGTSSASTTSAPVTHIPVVQLTPVSAVAGAHAPEKSPEEESPVQAGTSSLDASASVLLQFAGADIAQSALPLVTRAQSAAHMAEAMISHAVTQAFMDPTPQEQERLMQRTAEASGSHLERLTSGLADTDSTNLLSLSRFTCNSEISTVSSQMDTFLVRRLTPEENHMLQELMQVYDLSFTVDLEPLIHIKHLDPSLNQLVNQSSITVLRLIKFAKRLEEFVRLTQECQIGILKGTWIHILLVRSVSLYDSERDVWVTPRGDIPTEILKNATGFVQLHDDHVRYCKSIKSIIRDDLMIVVILLVIVLFSPEGPHVINRELVSNIQDKYLILLKHYLESKYTYVRAAEMYPQLMSKLKELKELAEIHGKYLLDVNPSEIEPIMLEILDLK